MQDLNKVNSTISHGLSKHPIYKAWVAMKGRCYNIKDASYHNYGGRGIFICDEWKNDFIKFYKWSLVNGWCEKLSIDRINNDGWYSPENCRWTTKLVQNRNMRGNIRFTAFNESKCLNEWSMDKRCVCSISTLRRRLMQGWNPEEAISKSIDFRISRRFNENGGYRKGIKLIEYKGQIKSATEWGEIFGLSPNIISWRLNNGWSVMDSLQTNKGSVKVDHDLSSGKFIKKIKTNLDAAAF